VTVWHIVAPHWFSIVGFAIALLAAADVLRSRRPAGTALAWLLAIGLVPFVGVPLYLIFGGRKMARLAKEKGHLFLTGEQAPRPSANDFERMLCSLGAPPAREGNRVELLPSGEESYAGVIDAIGRAGRRIEIATLILAGDEVGAAVVERLVERAKQGVEVRVLIDALFAFRSSRPQLKALERAGGRVAFFMPVLHVPFRGHANLRLHRKMVLIDDRLAVVGGMNIAREYMGPVPIEGRWTDLSMRVEGPAVADLAQVFRSDWSFAAQEQLTPFDPPAAIDGGEPLQIVASGPDTMPDRIYDALLDGFFRARRRIFIATPYFVPDDALARALMLAARRGLDVRVLVPARSNHRIADFAGASYLRALADAGVRVQLFRRGMMHAKVVLLDDDLALLGSANVDMRSLFLDYEVALACTDRARIGEVAAWFERVSQGFGALEPPSRARAAVEDVARLLGPIV
jgi:cardiolipin synthase